MKQLKKITRSSVIARWQATHHIGLCEFANMQAERRNRKIGEIRRLCDYDVANAPRNDSIQSHGVTRHCEERSDEAIHLTPHPVATLLPSPARGEGACHNNSGTPQRLINVKGLARASRGRALSSKMTKSLQTTSADPFNASEQDFTYSPIRLFTSKCAAFTLAEILVTLAVIGIVATMTIPNLVNNYKTQVNVVKIKKFYSMFNQAIELSEADNGPINSWFLDCGTTSEPTCTIDEVEDWYNNYLGKYIKTTKVEKDSQSTPNRLYLYFADGSVVDLFVSMRDVSLYTSKGDYYFAFIFNGKSMTNGPEQWENCSSYLDTYCYYWDGTREGLIEGRNYAEAAAKKNSAYCTKLLQYDGWVVKDDNPCKYY